MSGLDFSPLPCESASSALSDVPDSALLQRQGLPTQVVTGELPPATLARLAVPRKVSPEDLRAFEAALAGPEGELDSAADAAGKAGPSVSVGDMTAALRARWDPVAGSQSQPAAQVPLEVSGPAPAPGEMAHGQSAMQPAAQPALQCAPEDVAQTPLELGAQPQTPPTVQARKLNPSEDAEDAGETVSSAEALVPRSPWETMPVVPAVTLVPTVVVQATPAPVMQGPAADRFEVVQIVQQVTRALAWRDLDALQAGREVVLHLDDALLPQTVLTFRPSVAAADGLGAEVVVSLQTQSTEVREFLDTHGQELVEAMARQAPGLRWAPVPELAWHGTAGAVALVLTGLDPTLRTADAVQAASAVPGAASGQGARDDDRSSSSGRGDGSSGQQDRDSGQGQPSSQGQGAFQGAPNGAGDRGNVDAASRWADQSEAARGRAAAAFADAVDAAAAKPNA